MKSFFIPRSYDENYDEMKTERKHFLLGMNWLISDEKSKCYFLLVPNLLKLNDIVSRKLIESPEIVNGERIIRYKEKEIIVLLETKDFITSIIHRKNKKLFAFQTMDKALALIDSGRNFDVLYMPFLKDDGMSWIERNNTEDFLTGKVLADITILDHEVLETLKLLSRTCNISTLHKLDMDSIKNKMKYLYERGHLLNKNLILNELIKSGWSEYSINLFFKNNNKYINRKGRAMKTTLICRTCGKDFRDDSDEIFCPKCRKKEEKDRVDTKKCGCCGKECLWNAASCRYCSSRFPTTEELSRECSCAFEDPDVESRKKLELDPLRQNPFI